MAKTRRKSDDSEVRRMRPGLTRESRENQLISLATNLAERQLLDGTASSQVITHYLKLGTRKYEEELEKLNRENELLRAKTEALQSAKNMEEMYADAIKAMSIYRGSNENVE